MSASSPATVLATALPEGTGTVVERARAFGAREAATSPLFVQNLRRAGLESLGKLGLPRPSDEEWRYTSVATVARRLPDFVGADAAHGASLRSFRTGLVAGPPRLAPRSPPSGRSPSPAESTTSSSS